MGFTITFFDCNVSYIFINVTTRVDIYIWFELFSNSTYSGICMETTVLARYKNVERKDEYTYKNKAILPDYVLL